MLVLSHTANEGSFRSDTIVLNRNVLRAEDIPPRAVKLTLTNGMKYIIDKPCVGDAGGSGIPCFSDVIVNYAYNNIIALGTCAAIQELEGED